MSASSREQTERSSAAPSAMLALLTDVLDADRRSDVSGADKRSSAMAAPAAVQES